MAPWMMAGARRGDGKTYYYFHLQCFRSRLESITVIVDAAAPPYFHVRGEERCIHGRRRRWRRAASEKHRPDDFFRRGYISACASALKAACKHDIYIGRYFAAEADAMVIRQLRLR